MPSAGLYTTGHNTQVLRNTKCTSLIIAPENTIVLSYVLYNNRSAEPSEPRRSDENSPVNRFHGPQEPANQPGAVLAPQAACKNPFALGEQVEVVDNRGAKTLAETVYVSICERPPAAVSPFPSYEIAK
jgi:hypothetical protein